MILRVQGVGVGVIRCWFDTSHNGSSLIRQRAFGGFDALYAETLVEAHRRALEADALNVFNMDDVPAKEKLCKIIRQMLCKVAQPLAKSWEFRLISRELVSPSAANTQFVKNVIEPHRRLIKSLIAETLNCRPEEPLVGRILLSIIAPGILLAIANSAMLTSIDKTLALHSEADIDNLVLQVECFILGGLNAMLTLAPQNTNLAETSI